MLSDAFPVQKILKHGDALTPVPFNPALQYAIRKVQEKKKVLELNGTHISFWSMLIILI
jgi:hypothetical protein